MNYNNYSIDHEVNMIPENDFKRLVIDTFNCITQAVGPTAGPYGSHVMTTSMNQNTTTKDGYNAFCALSFNNPYKRIVYLAIKNICERVNKTVGDGTTSTILIAEEIFRSLNDLINTPDDKRKLLSVLTGIENRLMNSTKIKGTPLTKDTLFNLVDMAANYDTSISNKIVEAFDPKYDENGNVISIRNVIPEEVHNMDGEETEIYTMNLPGDYHIRIKMQIEDIEEITESANIGETRVVLYDHAMTEAEFNNLEKPENDNDTLIIIARDFTASCLNKALARYAKQRILGCKRLNVFPCWVLGSNVKTELQDLAAVLNCEMHNLVQTEPVKWDDCIKVDIEIFNKNCMGFYINDKNHSKLRNHILKLEEEMAADLSNSIVENGKFKDRIRALKMETNDTIITCSGTSPLEMSMLMDKIQDCICIVNSAYEYGTVPNLLRFGYSRLTDIKNEYNNMDDDFAISIITELQKSIKSLFMYIYSSKYGGYDRLIKYVREEDIDKTLSVFYESESNESWDVITESFVDYSLYPTSAQYDVEVIVAGISIVKYLLTSKSLIFDPTSVHIQ